MTKEIIGSIAVGVPVVNEVTNDGVITALSLEGMSWLGMTYGAWFKIGMLVALFLLIVERSVSIWAKTSNLHKDGVIKTKTGEFTRPKGHK